jgi:hypothetical protein
MKRKEKIGRTNEIVNGLEALVRKLEEDARLAHACVWRTWIGTGGGQAGEHENK